MNIPYRTRMRLNRIGTVALILLLVVVLFCGCCRVRKLTCLEWSMELCMY